MTNAYKLYSPSHKYRIIDEQEFLDIAQDKVLYNGSLRKEYLNKEITKLSALKIYKFLNIDIQPVNAILVETTPDNIYLKTIDKLEEELANFIIEKEDEYTEEEQVAINAYLKGSKEAMITLITKSLKYQVIDENRTLEEFIETEVYQPTELLYKKNKISISLVSNRYVCDEENKKIYKYQSSILDPGGFKFHFKKTELFAYREEAIKESKKLIDEHYNLSIRNGKVQKIIVRTDENNTIIIFWPDTVTEDNYITSNDIIGDHDLGGDTKTSISFFDKCKDGNIKQVIIAKNVIEKCLKLQTYNVKQL